MLFQAAHVAAHHNPNMKTFADRLRKARKVLQGHHNRCRAKTDYPRQRPVRIPSEMGALANLTDTVANLPRAEIADRKADWRVSSLQNEAADMYVAPNPTYADAVFDRLAHNGHRLDLDDESSRNQGPDHLGNEGASSYESAFRRSSSPGSNGILTRAVAVDRVKGRDEAARPTTPFRIEVSPLDVRIWNFPEGRGRSALRCDGSTPALLRS